MFYAKLKEEAEFYSAKQTNKKLKLDS